MKKLIIIPAYNESEAILSTVETIRREAPDFDYLIVNDCSTDSTKQILEEHHLNFLDLPVNLGIGGAVQTGYMYAYRHGYDMAVQVDGDGQHDPAFLKTMADHLENHHCDMVIGSRFIRKEGFQSSRARRMGIQWFSWLIRRMTGGNDYRSDVWSAHGWQKGDGAVQQGLSERLSRAGNNCHAS
jgi:glycosyltransferase involved in cell wall biosynthesis